MLACTNSQSRITPLQWPALTSLCVSSKNRRVTELNGSQDTVATAKSKSLLSETSLGLSLLRNRWLAAKDITTNDEAPAFARLLRKASRAGRRGRDQSRTRTTRCYLPKFTH